MREASTGEVARPLAPPEEGAGPSWLPRWYRSPFSLWEKVRMREAPTGGVTRPLVTPEEGAGPFLAAPLANRSPFSLWEKVRMREERADKREQ